MMAGIQNTKYFFTREVAVRAVNQTKKYGEQMPKDTSTVTVDG